MPARESGLRNFLVSQPDNRTNSCSRECKTAVNTLREEHLQGRRGGLQKLGQYQLSLKIYITLCKCSTNLFRGLDPYDLD
jgi:hypothetical protein